MISKIFYLQLLFIVVSVYILYLIFNKCQIHNNKYIEGLETRKQGYITKMKKYHNKNIARPFRLKSKDLYSKFKNKYSKFKKWLL